MELGAFHLQQNFLQDHLSCSAVFLLNSKTLKYNLTNGTLINKAAHLIPLYILSFPQVTATSPYPRQSSFYLPRQVSFPESCSFQAIHRVDSPLPV